MKVYINEDELYPYFYIQPCRESDPEWKTKFAVDIPHETLELWQKVIEIFHAVQEAMRDYA